MTSPSRWTEYRHGWREAEDALGTGPAGLQYRDLPANVTVLLRDAVQRRPGAPAVRGAGGALTYRELWDAVLRGAMALRRAGVQVGDRVALLEPNDIGFAVWFLATALCGGVAAPLNIRLTADELGPLVELAAPRVLVTAPEGEDRAERVRAGVAGDVAVVASDAWRETAAGGSGEWPGLRTRGGDGLVLLYTSGTTGSPKAAWLTQRNVLTSVETYRRVFRLTAADRTLVVVPLFHVTGLVGQWLAMLRVGGEAVFMARYGEDALRDQLQTQGITFLFAVPTILVRLLGRSARAGEAVPALRLVASGGAALPPTAVERWRTAFPHAQLFNTYGMTEVSSPATILPAGEGAAKPGSCGYPVPAASLRLVRPADGEDVGPGEAGELWIRGPMVMSGYFRNAEATRRALSDGWLRSGDLARCDPDGAFYLLDRIKDLINRGGEKIVGAEVEQVVQSHPDVLEAAVVGVADPEWGEQVGAAVVWIGGASSDFERLRRWSREHLAAYKIPTRWAAVSALPRNANGKVDKRAVRDLLIAAGDPR